MWLLGDEYLMERYNSLCTISDRLNANTSIFMHTHTHREREEGETHTHTHNHKRL